MQVYFSLCFETASLVFFNTKFAVVLIILFVNNMYISCVYSFPVIDISNKITYCILFGVL